MDQIDADLLNYDNQESEEEENIPDDGECEYEVEEEDEDVIEEPYAEEEDEIEVEPSYEEIEEEEEEEGEEAGKIEIVVEQPPPENFDQAESKKDEDDEYNEEFEDFEEDDQSLWRYDHTFDKLREIYVKTITGLDFSMEKGVNLEPVKELFRTVWEGLETSYENFCLLTQKDHEMSVELSVKMARSKTLIKMAEDDPVLSQALRAKLDQAWRLSDAGEAEEKATIDKINALKDELQSLNVAIDNASKIEGQDTIRELNKIKQKLEDKKAALANESNRIHTEYEMIKLKRVQNDELKVQLADQIKMLEKEAILQEAAIKRETQRKEDLILKIEQTSTSIEDKVNDLAAMDQNILDAEKRLVEAELAVRDQKLVNEEATRDMEFSNARYEKMKADYDNQSKLCERLTMDLYKRQADLQDKEHEVMQLKSDIIRANRQLQLNQKKCTEYEDEFDKLEADREILRGKLAIMEEELDRIQQKMEANKRKVNELDKERSLINRNLIRAEAVTNEHVSSVKTHEVAVRNITIELAAYGREIADQKETISRLEKDRDNYSNEATKLAHTVAIRLDEIKLLDMSIFEYRKKLGELELQFKKQKQLYDAGVYDKAVLQRTVRDVQADISRNADKLRYLNHSLTNLRMVVREKELIVAEQAALFETIERDTAFYTSEAKRIKHLVGDVVATVEALEVERSTLSRTIAEAKGEISKQNYYASAAESRKNVYQRKLMAKEVELKQIWEKWRALNSTIRIGSYNFRKILSEIRLLRWKIFLMKKEKMIVKGNKIRYAKLRHEVVALETIISKETCMCNTLRDQLKHPINVHRWRILECISPSAFAKVQKINFLKKRLLDLNCGFSTQSADLKFKQQIYVQIRDVLRKCPGLESPEDVRYYQSLLAAKQQQYLALKDDLKSYEAQTEYYEEEIQMLEKKLKKLKLDYFKRMRDEIMETARRRNDRGKKPAANQITCGQGVVKEPENVEQKLQPKCKALN